MESNYQTFCEISNWIFDSKYSSWERSLFQSDVAWDNISIVIRPDWEFLSKLEWLHEEIWQKLGNQLLYRLDQLHTTIVFYEANALGDWNIDIIKQLLLKYAHVIQYDFLWFISAPGADGLVGILLPVGGWKEKLLIELSAELWVEPWTKSNNPIINKLRSVYAWMYLMKYKTAPSLKQIDYMKSLAHKSLWLRRPKQVLIYRTRSTLLNWAELLTQIELI